MKKFLNNNPFSIANSLKKIIKSARRKLFTRYSVNETFIRKKKINELIFNEDTPYTYLFKEFLVYEDNNEFLKRSYSLNEGESKLKRITIFYNRYSKMFPNYIVLPESKILYWNIQKKQKMIDNLQEILNQEEKQRKLAINFDYNTKKILNTSLRNSILNNSNSFVMNLNQIFNEYNNSNKKENDNKHNDNDYDNENYYKDLINKLINSIEELEKKNEEKKVIIKMISINNTSKIKDSELKKFHSQSPEQKQNINVIIKNKKQNASNSTHATSFLSTLNNNNKSKEKKKGMEKTSNNYSYFLSNCIMKNSSMTSMTPVNKQDITNGGCNKHNNSTTLLNNSILNIGNLTGRSQNKKITFNQNTNGKGNLNGNAARILKANMSNINQSRFNSKIPITSKPLNFSKINIQSIKTKLQKNIFDVGCLSHRSNHKSRIEILKGNALSKLDLMQSRNSLLSRLSQSLQNIHKNNLQGNPNANEHQVLKPKSNNKLVKNFTSPYNVLNKPSCFSDSDRKIDETSVNSPHNNILYNKQAKLRNFYQSKLTRQKYKNNIHGLINKN